MSVGSRTDCLIRKPKYWRINLSVYFLLLVDLPQLTAEVYRVDI